MRNETMSRLTAHGKINFLTSLKKTIRYFVYYVLKDIITDVMQLPLQYSLHEFQGTMYI